MEIAICNIAKAMFILLTRSGQRLILPPPQSEEGLQVAGETRAREAQVLSEAACVSLAPGPADALTQTWRSAEHWKWH